MPSVRVRAPFFAGYLGLPLQSWVTPAQGKSVTPVDLTTNKILHTYQQVIATTSGITLCTGCYGAFPSRKFSTAASQNGSLCLNVLQCGASSRTPAAPAIVTRYDSNDCTAPVQSTTTLSWRFAFNVTGWEFSIGGSEAVGLSLHSYLVFYAKSEGAAANWCFPVTLNNLLDIADCGTVLGPTHPAQQPGFSTHGFGYGGSVTISLADCDCP